jgi:Ala-tRNA(Pro) deacylase
MPNIKKNSSSLKLRKASTKKKNGQKIKNKSVKIKNKKAPKVSRKKARMKLPDKVIKYLEKAGVAHEILEHKTVYTAFDAASTMRKKLEEIAKSLLVIANKDYYLIIVPADHNLDFVKLNAFLSKQSGKDYKTVKIPGEKIMTEIFKIKAGTLSAFGKMYNLPVVMDKAMTRVKKGVFSSGSFNHSVEMAIDDFLKIENAALGSFGVKKKIKVQKIIKPKKIKKKINSKKNKS